MEQSAKKFVDELLAPEVLQIPSDSVKPEELALELPKWFDEEKFNRARKFYWAHCFSFSTSMLLGLVAVFSVPSILKVLIDSRRSSSIYTAYRRYLSTLLHVQAWFEHELKPGSTSWKSLFAVRSRHLRAGLSSKLKGGDVVSQRDIALTQFGFIGYSMLKPDKLGIRQLKSGDWDAYNHFWRTIGYMIGLEDRYNICRETFEETLIVCQQLQDRVFTPCLENVPEYFEHMARVMLDGMWSVNPTVDLDAVIYFTKYLSDVPGYIYSEADRINLQNRIREQLKGKPLDTGVDSSALINKPALDGLPKRAPKLMYLKEYDTIDTAPEYNRLSAYSKYKLGFNVLGASMYTTYLGRLYFNLNFLWSLILMKYFPYIAFIRFGIKKSFVNIFEEDPKDDTTPKPNSEYYKNKPKKSWYLEWLSFFW